MRVSRSGFGLGFTLGFLLGNLIAGFALFFGADVTYTTVDQSQNNGQGGIVHNRWVMGHGTNFSVHSPGYKCDVCGNYPPKVDDLRTDGGKGH